MQRYPTGSTVQFVNARGARHPESALAVLARLRDVAPAQARRVRRTSGIVVDSACRGIQLIQTGAGGKPQRSRAVLADPGYKWNRIMSEAFRFRVEFIEVLIASHPEAAGAIFEKRSYENSA